MPQRYSLNTNEKDITKKRRCYKKPEDTIFQDYTLPTLNG